MTAGAVGLFLCEYDGALARGEPGGRAGRGPDHGRHHGDLLPGLLPAELPLAARLDLPHRALQQPRVLVGIGVLLLLQAAFIYLPLFNDIFGTHPLDPTDVALAAAVGAVVLPVVSIEKWFERRRTRPAAA